MGCSQIISKIELHLYIVIVINSVSNKRRKVGEERYPSLDVLGLFFCIYVLCIVVKIKLSTS